MTLIDRLSKLDGPCGAMDRDICKHLGLLSSMTCEYNHWPLRVTSSVDDAIALADKVLPGKQAIMGWGQTRDTLPWVRLGNGFGHDATGATLAIALCIAILRAKEASYEP